MYKCVRQLKLFFVASTKKMQYFATGLWKPMMLLLMTCSKQGVEIKCNQTLKNHQILESEYCGEKSTKTLKLKKEKTW